MSQPTPTKSVLGKGLASLLPGASPSVSAIAHVGQSFTTQASAEQNATPVLQNKDRQQGISVANVDDIFTNEYQPRRDFDLTALEELAQSIRENGLIQPLIVRRNGEKLELIAGERRLRASKIAGLKTVPVVIRRSTDREALELAIVENIQREDLNCVDEALAYFQLLQEFQLSQEELSKKMGKERATIANALRVLKLSDYILSELKKGTLSRGHAKALLSIEDSVAREKFAKEIIEKNLSVRQAEKTAQEVKTSKNDALENSAKNKSKKLQDPELLKLTNELTRRYMSKIEFRGDKKTGSIQIEYSSEAELVRIFSLLLGDHA